MLKSEINLGDLVQDKVTGVKGIATSKVEFLNGCMQVEVTPRLKEGTTPKAEDLMGIGIDIQQLKRIGNGLNTPVKKVAVRKKRIVKEVTGGPMRVIQRSIY